MKHFVSKNSLFTITVSIILLCVIMLTTTFAAFSSQSKVNGSITLISPDLALTISVGSNNSIATLANNKVTINIDKNDIQINNSAGTMTLTQTAQTDLKKIAISTTFKNPKNNSYNLSVETTETKTPYFCNLFSFETITTSTQSAAIANKPVFKMNNPTALTEFNLSFTVTFKAAMNL